MKTKPLIIAGSFAVILITAVLFILYGKSKQEAGADDVNAFLEKLTNYANNGQTDSLINCFAAENQNIDGVKRLVNVLAGKSSVNGKAAPLAKLTFILNESVSENLADGTTSTTIPLYISNNNLEQRRSLFTLKLTKLKEGGYKIIQADVRQFFTDFVAYENYVRSKTLKDEDIYQPETLAAFATAAKLSATCDSVIWFSHVGDKTYYYVVNGDWKLYSMDYDTDPAYKTSYKMGLVGPDLKPIIPIQFDIVRHIGETFHDMIEVEKDHKKGFYDINGKEVLPVKYDQIFPISGNSENIAALRIGDEMYWFKSDFTVSERVDIKIADILPNLSKTGSFAMTNGGYGNLTEFNSRDEHASIYLPPSYMVDLNLLPVFKMFKNPLRRKVDYADISENYMVTKESKQNSYGSDSEGWLQSFFYTIRDYYLGGRAEFYDRKNVVIVDNKRNRIYTEYLSTDYSPDGSQSLEGPCNISSVRAITDSLFEVKLGAVLYIEMYYSTQTLSGGPYYHYLAVKGNKVEELYTNRTFAFTKFVKMDDTYLSGCYLMDTYNYVTKKNGTKNLDHLTEEMLRYAKNEIYADYGYKFSERRWNEVFSYSELYKRDKEGEVQYSVNAIDSLTAIDKYNINFIDQKLKNRKTTTLAAK